MKLFLPLLILVSFSQNLFADGASLGLPAIVAANLVRTRTVEECIGKVETQNRASATISDVRALPLNSGYEVEVFLRNMDIARGHVTLLVTSHVVSQAWGPVRVYECKELHQDFTNKN